MKEGGEGGEGSAQLLGTKPKIYPEKNLILKPINDTSDAKLKIESTFQHNSLEGEHSLGGERKKAIGQ